MDPVRVRVVFEERHILNKSQKKEGLKQCWLHLKPELATISDLASHLIHSFSLQHSCPNGLVLSMDGFVLPSFESTLVLKDEDIIRVRKKCGISTEVIKLGDDLNHIEDSEIVEKQPLLLSDKLLAITEFEKESGGYKSEDEEDTDGQNASRIEASSKRKRKHSDKHLGSKKKKTKVNSPVTCPLVSAEDAEDIHLKQKENYPQNGGINKKSLHGKGRSIDGDGASDAKIISEVNGTLKITVGSAFKEERHDKFDENRQGNGGEPDVYGDTKKLPSRSARRKKIKRQLRRELVNSLDKEFGQNHIPEKDMHQASPVHEKQDGDDDVEEEIVPIVVRPGYIRFEQLEQSTEQLPDPVVSLRWTGTTSKKKGQKWGRENTFDGNMRVDNGFHAECNESPLAEEGQTVPIPVDFEKLVPLSSLPKEGDVIAYRLVELSSSWCPELSPYRVGKVSSNDSKFMKVSLVPVPEYPIFSNENNGEDESTVQSDPSLYKEDGSLEIDFQSLVDVRIFNNHKSETTASLTKRESTDEVSLSGNGRSEIKACGDQNPKERVATMTEKRQDNGWEEISQALNEKKAQLLQKNGWSSGNKKENPTSISWSYKALRGSALGPTISMLRAKNDL